MTPFRTVPSGALTLRNLTAPGCLTESGAPVLQRVDLGIADGRLTEPAGEGIDMGGAMVFAALTDMHTHLDKGHISPRKPNPDGSFMGAIEAVADDRAARWSAEDVRRRMDFSLRSAFAHGTAAIRTHLDSIPPQEQITWAVFREMRAEWADRISLQGVSLMPSMLAGPDGPMPALADLVAEIGGVLGLVTQPAWDLPDRLRHFLGLAADRGLAVDLHVDESNNPTAATLRQVAEAVLDTGFENRVVVGHCCSLAVQDPTEAARTLDLVARAGLHAVCMPMCNLYLQDRGDGSRTPRWRGITLVHEMRERGIPVSFASDNTRDPFYAYGDLDMLEVMREAVRIGHLDHTDPDWMTAFLTGPAETCGLERPRLTPGAPADLVICAARNLSELLARPQSDRLVIRGGEMIDRALPDYADLDDLMEPA